jgi:hypothetical protein
VTYLSELDWSFLVLVVCTVDFWYSHTALGSRLYFLFLFGFCSQQSCKPGRKGQSQRSIIKGADKCKCKCHTGGELFVGFVGLHLHLHLADADAAVIWILSSLDLEWR